MNASEVFWPVSQKDKTVYKFVGVIVVIIIIIII
jgi:hypothetical protein